MYTIIFANKEKHLAQIWDLFFEYLQWINTKLIEEYGMGVDDVEGYVEADIQHIDKFMPPMGRLLLGYIDDRLAGMAALKELSPGVGEIKRMYVRSEFRRQGLGRALLQQLLAEAAQAGYQCLRLDSAPFLPESHNLYHTSGFRDILPYEGTEIPKAYHRDWLFMEKELQRKSENVG